MDHPFSVRVLTIEDFWIGVAMLCLSTTIATYGISLLIGLLLLYSVHKRDIPRMPSGKRSLGIGLIIWSNIIIGFIASASFSPEPISSLYVDLAVIWILISLFFFIGIFVYYQRRKASWKGKYCTQCGNLLNINTKICIYCHSDFQDVIPT